MKFLKPHYISPTSKSFISSIEIEKVHRDLGSPFNVPEKDLKYFEEKLCG